MMLVLPWASAANSQGGPGAIVVCGALNNAQVTTEQCFAAMVQDFNNRLAAYGNQFNGYVAQLNAQRASLYQECQALHSFAGQIGYDMRSWPPC